MKKINGKQFQNTFDTIFEAKQWRKYFDGISYNKALNDSDSESNYSTLKEVWEVMQKHHFPTLATRTKSIWHRNKITPSKITSWVNKNVTYFKSTEYQEPGGGRADR